METVYIVDSDSAIRDALTTLLESYDLRVKAYVDSDSFLQAARGSPAGCVLVEAELPGLNGLGLLRRLRNEGNTIPVVLLTSNAKPDFIERAERAGAAGVLEKPFASDELVNRLPALVGREAWTRMTLLHASEESLSDGARITIRPIRPSDRQLEQAFVRSLSPMSKHYRFFSGVAEPSDSMLDRFTHMHYPADVALIATVMDNDTEEEVGVARYAKTGDLTADFAVAVADTWQGRGVATHLLKKLMTIAKQAGVAELDGTVLRENRDMLELARHLGFALHRHDEDASAVCVSKRLAR
jgi:FixJ family two-component response regulator/GNAT superfamily N-acetyltransferase